MLINVQLLTSLSETVRLLQYERLGSSAEKEELYGAAPDQEEERVSLSDGFTFFV